MRKGVSPKHVIGDEIDYPGPDDPTEMILINAEEVRQFAYCQRVMYWRRVVGIRRQMTPLMNRGVEYHQQRQRSLYQRKEDIATYKNRYFKSEVLQIGGKLDLCRETEDGIHAVEYKRYFHGFYSQGHLMQAVIGGLAAEEVLGKPLMSVEIQYYPGKSTRYAMNADLRSEALKVVDQLRKMIIFQVLPAVTVNRKKCKVCEYHFICQPEL